MIALITSFMFLFGLFEFFALLGILDFTWAMHLGQTESRIGRIDGPAHWVTKNGEHVRNADAEDIQIYNKNVPAHNKWIDKHNAAIRERNKGAIGRAFAEWKAAPFYVKYGNKKASMVILTTLAFLYIGYNLSSDTVLLRDGENPLASLIFLAINIIYAVVFSFLFMLVHWAVCQYFEMILKDGVKEDLLLFCTTVVTFTFKAAAMVAVILLIMRRDIFSMYDPAMVDSVFQTTFLCLFCTLLGVFGLNVIYLRSGLN